MGRPTSEKQPEDSAAHFSFDWVEAFVRRLFVHVQSHCDVHGLTEGSVRCCIVAFAEVVASITERTKNIRVPQVNNASAQMKGGSQVSNDHVSTRRRVVRCDSDMPACFMANLGESPDLFAFYQRKVASGHLD